MARYLFVSLPLSGHVNPLAAVSRALVARGHDVMWAGSESFLRPVLGPDTPIAAIPLRAHRGQADRGMAAAKSRWEGYIVPHARVTLPGIEKAVASFRPDALVVDQHAVAGAVAAHRAGLPWASMAPTTMELTRPYRALPKVEAWLQDRMAEIWTGAGMPGAPPHDLRFSPHLLVAFTGEALNGPLEWPGNAVLVGPALAPRPPDTAFPWHRLDPSRRLVLVTVGTLALDLAQDFHARVVEALRPLAGSVQAVVVAPEGTVADTPDVLVRPRVPVLELLPRLDAVISHGGLNTVCETLAHGVPLVVAPIKGDQPINAARVAAVGAGRRVRFASVRPKPLREDLLAVLDDPSYRAAARRIGDSFAAAGGADSAAAHLERLTHSTPRTQETGDPT
ncbi:glycosyltransferase [Actinacidiphila epipremni]|uniref:Glycosyltransferase n=1 Tax=Actinacidiphila epipremni TaxID=2053013 RepID=A0ABX0ZJM4_9ACTN|nr:nucleotide disphospho-sugar-binding domain-containing protein [Actinacidiphila epipremni]NJP43975.1 glycosyltransferase [Actinacidiphila epipremni]